MINRQLVLALIGIGFSINLLAQPIMSNIYLFDLKKENDREFQFSNPQYLTSFNSTGYNNQPHFLSNSELYFTAQMEGEDQTDIYLLDIYGKTKSKVTETVEAEYSPTIMPDAFNFSAVRVETDGRQRLWQFPVDRLSNGKPIFKYIENVGYFEWINSRNIALFLVGDQNQLALANVNTDEVKELARNVGRCFKMIPKSSKMAFVQKATPRTWYIKSVNVYDPYAQSEIVTTTLPGAEDFVVLEDGTYLMGSKSKLFKFHPTYDNERGWREIADLQYYGIRNITRLAISKNGKIAIVNEEQADRRF